MVGDLDELKRLAEAGDWSKLNELLLDPAWLYRRLSTAATPHAIVSEYELYARSATQRLIGRTLRLIIDILAVDRRQLLPQLIGRLQASKDPEIAAFVDSSRRLAELPALVPFRPSLIPPGAESSRLHVQDKVYSLAVLQDGRLAAGLGDSTVAIWGLESPVPALRLGSATIDSETAPSGQRKPQTGSGIRTLQIMPDGQLAAATQGAIEFWDASTGVANLRVTDGRINGHRLVVMPDGILASEALMDTQLWRLGAGIELGQLDYVLMAILPDGTHVCRAKKWQDGTIILREPTTNSERARLTGHTHHLMVVIVLPDGRLASGSMDGTVRIWAPETGAECNCLKGHSTTVAALAALADGRLASGSWDGTIRIWDLTTGSESARLEGHGDQVHALVQLVDGRLASGSSDNTIRIWDLPTGDSLTEAVRRIGHSDAVCALALLHDGRLASGSADKTIRVWDLSSGSEDAYLESGHSQRISALAPLPEGLLASGSLDHTIRFHELTSSDDKKRPGWLRSFYRNRISSLRIRRHAKSVWALTALADGRLVSASEDGSVKLWRIATFAFSQTIKPDFSSWDLTVAALRDGRLAIGGVDQILLWNIQKQGVSARLKSDRRALFCPLAVLDEDRLASGYQDHSIRVWDTRVGTELLRLQGHTNDVRALTAMPDGRLASGSFDKTIRIWDLDTKRELCRLEVDAPVFCLLALPNGSLVAGDKIGRLHWLQLLGDRNVKTT